MTEPPAPTPTEIRSARSRLEPWIRRTPVVQWNHPRFEQSAPGADVWLKLELFQHTGTFKARGALSVMLDMNEAQRERGVVAVSAGNHALAVAFASNKLGTDARVVMPRNADPTRVARCRSMGADVILMENVHAAFTECMRIAEAEDRVFVHPFEGAQIALGTATLGLEIVEQVADVEAVVVPVGGGGLCAGVAAAVRQLRPDCLVIGVEPAGADSMHRSFAAGEPRSIDSVQTIADSLGAPYAMPYSFSLCRRFVHQLVQVRDEDLVDGMRLLAEDLNLIAEPACAAATAAILGPAADLVRGKRTAAIACGSNIDAQRWSELVANGSA